MKTTDFSRSFLTFRIDTRKKPPQTASHKPPFSLNNARIQIECWCRVTEQRLGEGQTFVLGASCKTERVGVDRDLWLQPNADFAPVFSEDSFLNIKTYARCGMEVDLYPPGSGRQSDRQSGRTADAFDNVRIDLVDCEGELLSSADEIVRATLANERLVARTEIETDRYSATIEYPIKTMNANERDMIYQADTGPVLLPDLSCDPAAMLNRCELAFAAFNCPQWVEFIVRAPAQVGENISVYHYWRPLRFEAGNQVIRIL